MQAAGGEGFPGGCPAGGGPLAVVQLGEVQEVQVDVEIAGALPLQERVACRMLVVQGLLLREKF